MKIRSINRLPGCEVLTMGAVSNQGGSQQNGQSDDNAFAKGVPAAELTITVANPELLGKFNPGEYCYLDFIPVDVPQSGKENPA